MNDRYLYRAKRIDNGEWAKGSLFAEGEITEIIRGTCNTIGIEGVDVNPETICQCTGLKDKNGNLVWENDVVKTNNGRLCKVFWFSSSLYQGYDLKPIESENPAPTKWDIWYDIEVIGNIFDNPELINE